MGCIELANAAAPSWREAGRAQPLMQCPHCLMQAYQEMPGTAPVYRIARYLGFDGSLPPTHAASGRRRPARPCPAHLAPAQQPCTHVLSGSPSLPLISDLCAAPPIPGQPPGTSKVAASPLLGVAVNEPQLFRTRSCWDTVAWPSCRPWTQGRHPHGARMTAATALRQPGVRSGPAARCELGAWRGAATGLPASLVQCNRSALLNCLSALLMHMQIMQICWGQQQAGCRGGPARPFDSLLSPCGTPGCGLAHPR